MLDRLLSEAAGRGVRTLGEIEGEELRTLWEETWEQLAAVLYMTSSNDLRRILIAAVRMWIQSELQEGDFDEAS